MFFFFFVAKFLISSQFLSLSLLRFSYLSLSLSLSNLMLPL